MAIENDYRDRIEQVNNNTGGTGAANNEAEAEGRTGNGGPAVEPSSSAGGSGEQNSLSYTAPGVNADAITQSRNDTGDSRGGISLAGGGVPEFKAIGYADGGWGDISNVEIKKVKLDSSEEPKEKAPGGEEPKEKAPSGDEPKEKAPSGEEPKEKAPSGEEPKEKAPGGEEPKEKAPSGDEPKEKAPGGEEPKEKAPSGDELKDKVSPPKSDSSSSDSNDVEVAPADSVDGPKEKGSGEKMSLGIKSLTTKDGKMTMADRSYLTEANQRLSGQTKKQIGLRDKTGNGDTTYVTTDKDGKIKAGVGTGHIQKLDGRPTRVGFDSTFNTDKDGNYRNNHGETNYNDGDDAHGHGGGHDITDGINQEGRVENLEEIHKLKQEDIKNHGGQDAWSKAEEMRGKDLDIASGMDASKFNADLGMSDDKFKDFGKTQADALRHIAGGLNKMREGEFGKGAADAIGKYRQVLDHIKSQNGDFRKAILDKQYNALATALGEGADGASETAPVTDSDDAEKEGDTSSGGKDGENSEVIKKMREELKNLEQIKDSAAASDGVSLEEINQFEKARDGALDQYEQGVNGLEANDKKAFEKAKGILDKVDPSKIENQELQNEYNALKGLLGQPDSLTEANVSELTRLAEQLEESPQKADDKQDKAKRSDETSSTPAPSEGADPEDKPAEIDLDEIKKSYMDLVYDSVDSNKRKDIEDQISFVDLEKDGKYLLDPDQEAIHKINGSETGNGNGYVDPEDGSSSDKFNKIMNKALEAKLKPSSSGNDADIKKALDVMDKEGFDIEHKFSILQSKTPVQKMKSVIQNLRSDSA